MSATRLFFAAPLAFAASFAMIGASAEPARADVVRDHRGSAGTVRDHRRATTQPPPPRRATPRRTVLRPPRNIQPRAPRRALQRSYYSNGQWVYHADSTATRDPLSHHYPRFAASEPLDALHDETGQYVWSPGHWDLYQGRWIWIEGRWIEARAGYLWQPTRWIRSGGGYIRQAGHWERDYRPRQRAVWR